MPSLIKKEIDSLITTQKSNPFSPPPSMFRIAPACQRGITGADEGEKESDIKKLYFAFFMIYLSHN